MKMAAEMPSVIEEELLCCPLCMRSFSDPRILPCLHTFCRPCLDKHLTIRAKPPIAAKPLLFTNTGIDPRKQTTVDKLSDDNQNQSKSSSNDGQNRNNSPNIKSGAGNKRHDSKRPPTPARPTPRQEFYEECHLYEDVDPNSSYNTGEFQNVYEEPKECEVEVELEKPSHKEVPNPSKEADTPAKQTVPSPSPSPTKSSSPSVGKIVNNLFKRFPVRRSKEDKQKSQPELPLPRRTSLPEKGHSPIVPKRQPVPNTEKINRRPVPLPPPDVIMGDPTFQNQVCLKGDRGSGVSEDSYSVAQDPVGFLTHDHYTPPPELMCRNGKCLPDDNTSYLSATDSSSLSFSTAQDEDEYLTPTPSVSQDTSSPLKALSPNCKTIDHEESELIQPNEEEGESSSMKSKDAEESSSVGITISGNPAIVKPVKKYAGRNDKESDLPSDLWSNCPICDVSFQLPAPGLRGLRNNSFLTRLQDVVLSQSNVDKKCNNCEKVSAKFRCLDCRHYLCGGCRDAHNWLKITKHHRVMSLGELRTGRYQRELTQKQEIKCEIHQSKTVSMMCLFCDTPICYECKLNAHSDHRSGSLEEASERDRDLVNSLRSTVLQSKKKFEETSNSLKSYEKQCREEKKELMECLQHQKDMMVNNINECFLDLAEEIEKAYTEELGYKDKVAITIDGTISHMKHSCELAEQLLTHGKTEDLLLMSKMIKVNLNNFNLTVPYELDTRPFVQYSPAGVNKQSLISLFGRLARRRHNVARPRKAERKWTVETENREKKEHKDVYQLHSFRAKTVDDSLGCKPTGMTISTNDDIILVDDINKKIKVYDPSGVVKLDMCPQGENALIDPWDVTITYEGHLAVTDRGARKVKVFDACGRLMSEFGPHLKSPWGIAANSCGYLIVSDILAKTVFVNDQDGNLLYPIECRGHDKLFMCPEYVAINHNDDIIVSDFEKHCLTVFDSQGRFLYKYGTRGTGPHEFNVPGGVCVDKKGHVLAVDYSNRRIHVLSRDGQFERFLLTGEHGLITPQTMAVNSQGHLVVADGTHIKIFDFHIDTEEPETEGSKVYEPLHFYNKIYEGQEVVKFSRLGSDSEA